MRPGWDDRGRTGPWRQTAAKASRAVLPQHRKETMAPEDRREKAETGTAPEVANLGIMRPPLVYLGAIALGLLLHFAWPVRLVSRAVSVPLGGTVVLVAVA